jgi:hypothetical protein
LPDKPAFPQEGGLLVFGFNRKLGLNHTINQRTPRSVLSSLLSLIHSPAAETRVPLPLAHFWELADFHVPMTRSGIDNEKDFF